MDHWDGMLCRLESQITTGLPEDRNSLIPPAREKARGYRTHKTSSIWLTSSWASRIRDDPLEMTRNHLFPNA
jgi:hypothetical protein